MLRVSCKGQNKSSCDEKNNGDKAIVQGDMSSKKKSKKREMDEMPCQVRKSKQNL